MIEEINSGILIQPMICKFHTYYAKEYEYIPKYKETSEYDNEDGVRLLVQLDDGSITTIASQYVIGSEWVDVSVKPVEQKPLKKLKDKKMPPINTTTLDALDAFAERLKKENP